MSTRRFGVTVNLEFSAAHHIRGYQGDCARPHGHNFRVEVDAEIDGLNSIGIAVDFKELKAITRELVDRFDHQDLNLIAPFTDVNPTSETLAQYFFEEIERRLVARPELAGLKMRRVRVWESERSAASFGVL